MQRDLKMRTFLAFIVTAFALVLAEDYLVDEDKAIIQDEKQFRAFYTCMMDQGPCPEKLKTLREVLPKYIETDCAECSPKEKEFFERNKTLISEGYPKEFKDLLEKYGSKNQ